MPRRTFKTTPCGAAWTAEVWVCHFGANLPCQEKANTSQEASQEMQDYCQANPETDVIPAAVTGRATVYEWKCTGGEPKVVRQVFQSDPQGYLADFWYELPAQPAPAQLPNPASENCIAQGGTLSIETRGDGGQYGVCLFEDNRQCEEWALLRGDCPVGGLKVTGYVTPAAIYCAITGGEYAVTGESNTGDEEGTCTFPDGTVCDVWEYYNGQCAPGPTLPTTGGLIIQPLPAEVCNGQAQAMSHALGDLVPTQSEEPLTDPTTNADGHRLPGNHHGHRGAVREPGRSRGYPGQHVGRPGLDGGLDARSRRPDRHRGGLSQRGPDLLGRGDVGAGRVGQLPAGPTDLSLPGGTPSNNYTPWPSTVAWRSSRKRLPLIPGQSDWCLTLHAAAKPRTSMSWTRTGPT